jgi:hypothetical protein
MSLRAVLLSCAIANAAAFIAPSRAPQWLAPQLAAVLPPRALPTASVTRRDEVDKRFDILQVCPARHPVALGTSRAWPGASTRGMGAEGKPGVHPKQVLVRSAHSSICSKPALSIGA